MDEIQENVADIAPTVHQTFQNIITKRQQIITLDFPLPARCDRTVEDQGDTSIFDKRFLQSPDQPVGGGRWGLYQWEECHNTRSVRGLR